MTCANSQQYAIFNNNKNILNKYTIQQFNRIISYWQWLFVREQKRNTTTTTATGIANIHAHLQICICENNVIYIHVHECNNRISLQKTKNLLFQRYTYIHTHGTYIVCLLIRIIICDFTYILTHVLTHRPIIAFDMNFHVNFVIRTLSNVEIPLLFILFSW